MSHQLYTPNPDRPMQVAVFGSGTGTVLEELIAGEGHYKIHVVVTDRQCHCLEIAGAHGIPTIYHSYKQLKEKHPANMPELFDEILVASLKNFDSDMIFLAGYMRLVQKPLLNAFPNKILNVHPADLTILDENGNRKYVGMDAITEALRNGETATRSSVFIVDEHVDTGKIIAMGPKVPYTEESIERHREKHKRLSDWVTSVQALQLVAQGRVSLNEIGQVMIDHNVGIYKCAESSQSLMSSQ